jgi:hypothetical protein
MQRKESTKNENEESRSVAACKPQKAGPELLAEQVANISGEIVLSHTGPKEGSALEAASELNKLTKVLSTKATQIRALADDAFLGQAISEPQDVSRAIPNDGLEPPLSTDLREAVDEVEEKISQVRIKHGSPEQGAAEADALDKVASALEASSAQIKDLKVALTAKELNNMDGFDR